MKGVSDNNAPKKVKTKGSKIELKKPLQVLKLNKKDSQVDPQDESLEEKTLTGEQDKKISHKNSKIIFAQNSDSEMLHQDSLSTQKIYEPERFESGNKLEKPTSSSDTKEEERLFLDRTVDDFDFDENEFLAALNENEPIGSAGETIKGKIIALESDGLYIDIGGKAPGYMPKKECAIGVITNFKEKFPINLEMEVLVIKEQNADGMVTVSARALILRKSWEKVKETAKSGALKEVLINGFNRGGLTCDVEGLRGFIPRSQLEDGSDYQSLVGKIIKVAFLEVNSETRKLVLSEKKANLVTKFKELQFGQLIEGEILAIKPYGFFVDLGGASGLLHQSSVTKGSLRNLREVFNEGEIIKALVTEIDLERGRIGLDTSLLEDLPGEILIDKEKVMSEASERALKAQSLFDKKNNLR
tara:strand:+ start:741 stop:1985 length:1245 start_codon:yes stop_codon:yes gene_type:complete